MATQASAIYSPTVTATAKLLPWGWQGHEPAIHRHLMGTHGMPSTKRVLQRHGGGDGLLWLWQMGHAPKQPRAMGGDLARHHWEVQAVKATGEGKQRRWHFTLGEPFNPERPLPHLKEGGLLPAPEGCCENQIEKITHMRAWHGPLLKAGSRQALLAPYLGGNPCSVLRPSQAWPGWDSTCYTKLPGSREPGRCHWPLFSPCVTREDRTPQCPILPTPFPPQPVDCKGQGCQALEAKVQIQPGQHQPCDLQPLSLGLLIGQREPLQIGSIQKKAASFLPTPIPPQLQELCGAWTP